MRQPLATALILAVALLVGAVGRARAEEPDFLTFGAGYYDLFDDQAAAEARFEYRFSEKNKLLWFTPFVGLTATSDAATYGYAGIALDVFFGNRWVATPTFAAGLYGNGDGKDLGHAIEFRSGLEIAYRFDDYSRLGLSFTHISNAGIGERNPGVESLVLFYSVPFDAVFGE
ncbi:acyloxyacyl hydrolase [Thalassobaculum sp.]|uniref:acyloxyacyl hydrolase n=1 Tax=Thalassobaculum sp. TaxID=2022740 RepID=UPI003B5C8831